MKNNEYYKLLTIQDLSCVGQCSGTVALPIISALGIETCLLPTAVLSNHTTKDFNGFSCHDLSGELDAIFDKWKGSSIKFDCLYTGYLGDKSIVQRIIDNLSLLKEGAKVIIDPAMADNGKLYPAFNQEYVEYMKKLCQKADIILPNISEACLLTDTEYQEKFSTKDLEKLYLKISKMYSGLVVITGVPVGEKVLSIPVYQNGVKVYEYSHKRIPTNYHGTGDIFSSVFSGMYLKTKSLKKSIILASKFTYKSIEKALTIKNHKYGVPFEMMLSMLTKK